MTSLALTVAFAALSLASDETPESELEQVSGHDGSWSPRSSRGRRFRPLNWPRT